MLHCDGAREALSAQRVFAVLRDGDSYNETPRVHALAR
jgi:hypothetical protein